MTPLLQCLKDGEVLVADGAMGTMLMQHGLQSGQCPEQINLDRSDVLEDIARQYLKAGADIIQTNTFGGSPLKLVQYSLADKTEEINRNAVRAVRHVIGNSAYLAASCGPCGRILKPYGDTDPDEIRNSFERQIQALVDEGIDLLCIETMTDLTEATLAIEAAKSVSPSTTISATMTFDTTPNGFFTIMGVSIEQAISGLSKAGADIIGSNCGNGIENMVRIATEFIKHTSLPVIIQSNAGLPMMKGDTLVYPESPQFMAQQCRELLDNGVRIIGGCCGTTPEHISAIRTIVDSYANTSGQ